MNKKLFKNLLVFSDGSFNFDCNIYTSKKITYLLKDLKNYQENIKKKTININSNNTANYRKKLFK